MSRVLICGSRDVKITVDDIERVLDNYNITPDFIISGGARGPDRIAINFAYKNNIKFTELRPNWGIFGKRAGILRNMDMVDVCDVCIAFWNGVSKGTEFTINYAEKTNKKVIIEYHATP